MQTSQRMHTGRQAHPTPCTRVAGSRRVVSVQCAVLKRCAPSSVTMPSTSSSFLNNAGLKLKTLSQNARMSRVVKPTRAYKR